MSATGGIQSATILSLVGALTRWIYRGCDRILIQSCAFQKSVVKHGGDNSRIRYLPNYAESIFDIRMDKILDPESSTATMFKIMFAGNIGVAQDFATIVDAAELTRDHVNIRWLIVGDGRQKAWLKKEIFKRKLENIHLLGRYPKDEMPGVIANADVLLVTLKKEPLFALTVPSKIQAYLACGKPILASIDGEGARIVEDSKAGISIPAEQPGLLSSAAIMLANLDRGQLEIMGRNARNYYNANFSRDHILDEFEKVLMEVNKEP